jgi:hypothetical protein
LPVNVGVIVPTFWWIGTQHNSDRAFFGKFLDIPQCAGKICAVVTVCFNKLLRNKEVSAFLNTLPMMVNLTVLVHTIPNYLLVFPNLSMIL